MYKVEIHFPAAQNAHVMHLLALALNIVHRSMVLFSRYSLELHSFILLFKYNLIVNYPSVTFSVAKRESQGGGGAWIAQYSGFLRLLS